MLVSDGVSPSGERAKLLDFGMARLDLDLQNRHSLTFSNHIMGTPRYMSPEQCRGVGVIGPQTDVYSLGVMLYQLVAGQPPFVAAGIGELISLHLSQAPPPLPELAPQAPAALTTLIHQMLLKDPEQRPTMVQVVAALEQLQTRHGLLDHDLVAVPRPARPTPLIPSGRHSVLEVGERLSITSLPNARWSLLLGVLLGGVLVATSTWLLRPSRPAVTRPALSVAPSPAALAPVAPPPAPAEAAVPIPPPMAAEKPLVHGSLDTVPASASVVRTDPPSVPGTTPWRKLRPLRGRSAVPPAPPSRPLPEKPPAASPRQPFKVIE